MLWVTAELAKTAMQLDKNAPVTLSYNASRDVKEDAIICYMLVLTFQVFEEQI